MSLERADFDDLAGWREDNFVHALESFKKSCAKILNENDFIGTSQMIISANFMKAACAEANALPNDNTAIRMFFEANFDPYKVRDSSGSDKGTFTGYYEAELRAELTPDCESLVPIYGRPSDLGTTPYKTRAQIENHGLRHVAPVLFWAHSAADVHVLHIQGSGIVKTKTGEKYRIGFAASNNHQFSGIGSILMRNNVKVEGGYSMVAVRKWLRENPEEARKFMQKNDRFIFFRDIEGDGPIGAMGVPLTPGRSIAIDPEFIPYGMPMFLNANDPDGVSLNRLVVAQDTGTAIKGAVRVDYFWGAGEDAFHKAGRMKSTGSYFILLPKDSKNFAVKR